MGVPTVHRETPAEYFRALVEQALARQHLEAGELTAYYVVNLLCGFVRVGHGRSSPTDAEPLALQLAHALDAGGREKRERLQALGDVSLFVSGFFADSLARKVVDVDYYVRMGEYAYSALSQYDRRAFSDVFAELARKFVGFVDVLAEVSEQSGVSSNSDVLRLYEKWLRTGSRRDGARLVERGIVPNASIGARFLQ